MSATTVNFPTKGQRAEGTLVVRYPVPLRLVLAVRHDHR